MESNWTGELPTEGGKGKKAGSDAFGQTRSSAYERRFKAAFDRFIGAALLLISLPLLSVAAIVVRLHLGSPVIYRQQRIGKDGATFELFKLRTMTPDRRLTDSTYHGGDRRKTHKSFNDPRVLPTGKLLRSWRLDELPQFWNVIRGDMSLVGPRPEMPNIVAEYENWQHERHVVKPGVTGLWQVSDRNGHLMHECTEVDLEYLEHISFAEDLKILLKTPSAMIGQRRGH